MDTRDLLGVTHPIVLFSRCFFPCQVYRNLSTYVVGLRSTLTQLTALLADNNVKSYSVTPPPSPPPLIMMNSVYFIKKRVAVDGVKMLSVGLVFFCCFFCICLLSAKPRPPPLGLPYSEAVACLFLARMICRRAVHAPFTV